MSNWDRETAATCSDNNEDDGVSVPTTATASLPEKQNALRPPAVIVTPQEIPHVAFSSNKRARDTSGTAGTDAYHQLQQQPPPAKKALFSQPLSQLSSQSEQEDSYDVVIGEHRNHDAVLGTDELTQDAPQTGDSQATVPFNYTPCLTNVPTDDENEKESFYLYRADGVMISLRNYLDDSHNNNNENRMIISIGRDPDDTVQVDKSMVSRHHVQLLRRVDNAADHDKSPFFLQAYRNDVWILGTNEWCKLEKGKTSGQPLLVGSRFSLAPPGPKCPKDVQFQLLQQHGHAPPRCLKGSVSFDYQYLELLKRIETHGIFQTNKKGNNWTLRDSYTLEIDLQSSSSHHDADQNIVPITTLRKLYPRHAIVEALWYLRGEKHIRFLQHHDCPFWDKQARESDQWIGLNYGLLTNFTANNPYAETNSWSSSSKNQLELKVIQPLCDGQCSRNMVCTLSNPLAKTVQEACTTSVQFAVGHGGNDDDVMEDQHLDLTVSQRSSDAIIGLPHDVIAWSFILHLVRREVFRRSGRRLAAGKLCFCIAAGGAHVYEVNQSNMEDLLKRTPIEPAEFFLTIHSEQGIFDLAKTYDGKKSVLRVEGYTEAKHHPKIKIEQAI